VTSRPRVPDELVVDGGENYQLVRRKGRLVLLVVCGTVAQFLIYFPLDTTHLERFEKEGVAFLAQLAREVSRDPDAYLASDVRNFE